MKESKRIESSWFPEVGVGGFTSLDGTIQFYTRINALLEPHMTVLDFGAGRGAALTDSESLYKKRLMRLKGKVAKVVACDVDVAVKENPGADELVVTKQGESLPFGDATFDLIVSDMVLEHIANPSLVSSELERVLKPGGRICARTPNKYCLISLAARMIHNSQHSRILSKVQPGRKSIDMFPTVYKLNCKRDIQFWFKQTEFDNFTYRWEAEPSYYFNNRIAFALMLLINRLSPPVIKSGLFVFLRKKATD